MPRFLAIDADAHGLLVAAGTTRGSGVRLERTLAAAGTPALSPASAKALGAKLKELLKGAGVAAAPALVCVGRDRIVLKEIKHPPASPADEPAVVRFQAMKELTDGADEVILDYVPLGAGPDGGRRALVASVRREMLAAARVMCEAAGLKLAGLTPRPFAAAAALRRAFDSGAVPPPDAAGIPVAVVTLHDAGGEFVVVRGGLVRFARTVPAQAVASEASLVAELRRNLTVFAGQAGGDDVQAVYLAEGDGADGWAGRLRAALPVPVYPFDPLADAPGTDDIPAEVRGRFTGAAGLLAARAAGLPVNFQTPRQPRASADPKRSRALVGVLLGLLLLVGLGGGGLFLVAAEQKKVADLRLKVQQTDEEIKSLEPEIKRLAAAEEFDTRSVNWLDELYDWTDRFPDIGRMKVMAVRGEAEKFPTDKDRQAEAKLPKPKNPTPKAVAKLSLTVAAEDGGLPDQLVRELPPPYYTRSAKTGGGIAAGSKGLQQFVVTAGIAHRPPTEYTRRLSVTAPAADPPTAPEKKPAAADTGDDAP